MSKLLSVAVVLSAMLSVLSFGQVSAHHLCLADPSSETSVGPGQGIYQIGSAITDEWDSLGGEDGPLGCALSSEQDDPNGGYGRVVDFENGQITWSPSQKLIVAAYDPHANNVITVQWKITDQYGYDFFVVRWDVDGREHKDDGPLFFNCDFIGIQLLRKRPDKCWQQDVSGDRQTGSYSAIPVVNGRYSIIVEGCDSNGGLLGTGIFSSADCKQGWSIPTHVDVGSIDVAHKAGYGDIVHQKDAIPLSPAACNPSAGDLAKCHDLTASTSITLSLLAGGINKSVSTIDQIARVGFKSGCMGTLWVRDIPLAIDESTVFIALSKLYMARDENQFPGNCSVGWLPNQDRAAVTDSQALTLDVNNWLRRVQKDPDIQVGTTIDPLPVCQRHGDYDMALRVLIPLMYQFGDKLDADVRNHVLHDLLSEKGSTANLHLSNLFCGEIPIPETENHILMTESSRYLTNQLLLKERQTECDQNSQLSDCQFNAMADFRKSYDNKFNGMDAWMLGHLQTFFKTDFHEYNARPYAYLALDAIHNLAEYADNLNIRYAAVMLIDYLSAKYAVSGDGQRRAAPFRRHYNIDDYTPLFGNDSDAVSMQFLAWSGNTQFIDQARYGRADWGSAALIAMPGLGAYRVPPLILDLMWNKTANPFFQTFFHQGREVYAGNGEYLISGGGVWEPGDSGMESIPVAGGMNFVEDSQGAALPTTLMPSWMGIDRVELIQIGGSTEPKARSNTCVAPGFACGMNPVIPATLAQKFAAAGDCTLPVYGLIKQKWDGLGGADGLGCPLDVEKDTAEGIGRVQDFERGQIVWASPQKLVLAAWQPQGRSDIALNWNITDQFTYDYFNVRWDNKTNKLTDSGQCGESTDFDSDAGACQWKVKHDDPNGSSAGGGWFLTPAGPGTYRIVVEGCASNTVGSDTCGQGFSAPAMIDMPSLNSCARASGNFTFVDLSDRCGAPKGHGVYVVVYSAPCGSSQCRDASGLNDGGHWGFFAVADPYDPDPSFDDFVKMTLQDNGSRKFAYEDTNEFKTLDGRVIQFTLQAEGGKVNSPPGSPMGSVVPTPGRLVAQGDIIEADGSGCIVIKNPALNQGLSLDMRDQTIQKNTQLPIVQPLDKGSFCMPIAVPSTQIKFSADPSAITLGQCATVRWQVTNATQAFLDGQSVPLDSSKQDCPPAVGVYTHNLGVISLEQSKLKTNAVTITVSAAPPTPTPSPLPAAGIAFYADQYTLTRGQCTTLHWQSMNVSQTLLDSQPVALSGAKQDCPPQTVTHSLHVVTLDNQVVDRSLTIQVVAAPAPPPTPTPSPAPASPIKNGNLIVNGDGEVNGQSAASDDQTSPAPEDWLTLVRTGEVAVVRYGAAGGFPDKNSPGPANRGSNFFAGGPSTPRSEEGQPIDLMSWGQSAFALIDSSKVSYQFGAWLGGYADQDDSATVRAWFEDVNSNLISSATLTGPNAAARSNVTGFVFKNSTGTLPPGTRKIVVLMDFTRAGTSGYNDGYADDLSLVLTSQ